MTESMLIENPSSRCYVGRPLHDAGEPVTLRLAIPTDFERITFHKEAFGRRFALIGGSLVTGIPWPPGKRELSFTYVIPNDEAHRIWKRAIDLPCSHVRLTVRAKSPEDISCNLRPATGFPRQESCYESIDALPGGHIIRLELGHLPVPMMVYGRRAALLTLAALSAGVGVASIRRRRMANGSASAPRPATSGVSRVRR